MINKQSEQFQRMEDADRQRSVRKLAAIGLLFSVACMFLLIGSAIVGYRGNFLIRMVLETVVIAGFFGHMFFRAHRSLAVKSSEGSIRREIISQWSLIAVAGITIAIMVWP